MFIFPGLAFSQLLGLLILIKCLQWPQNVSSPFCHLRSESVCAAQPEKGRASLCSASRKGKLHTNLRRQQENSNGSALSYLFCLLEILYNTCLLKHPLEQKRAILPLLRSVEPAGGHAVQISNGSSSGRLDSKFSLVTMFHWGAASFLGFVPGLLLHPLP